MSGHLNRLRGESMKRILVMVIVLGVLAAAGCGTGTQKAATSIKQQTQNSMDKLNAALPYITDWSGYKSSSDATYRAKVVAKLVAAYPSLKRYLNAQGLFDPANYEAVDKVIATEDPVK